MINVIIEQRINPGMEAEFEALARQAEQSTLANDDGCLRYEWYRADETSTYILIERWRDLASVQAHMKAEHLVPIMQKLRLCVPEPSSVMRITKLS